MTEVPQPVAGSLHAKLIRACPEHKDCSLECPKRQVEDLGEIASFDIRPKEARTWRRLFRM